MSNHFDHLQEKAHNVVNDFYGYEATWAPSGGGEPKTGTVLFNDPYNIEKHGILQEFDIPNPTMEWKKGDIDGLFEAVENVGNREKVIINSITYNILSVTKLHDGKTYKAELDKRDD